MSRVSKKGIISLSYPPWPAYYSPARKRQRGRRISTLYLFTGRCARTLARRYTQKDDEPRGREQKDYWGDRTPSDLAIPTCLRRLPRMRLPFWLLRVFFPPTDCPTVDPSRYSPPPRPALYPSVLRMLPTRFNGGLVRACTRLLRLLAATRCSWHSYLNVISMFLRTARSYPCTHYVASPILRYLILPDIRLP